MKLLLLIIISIFQLSFIDLNSAMESAGYNAVPLKKNLFGEYILACKINNHKFEMMVSMGIDQTFIDKIISDKYEFESTLIENRDLQLNGDESQMYAVKVNEFLIGDIKGNENEIGAIDFSDFRYLKKLRVEGIIGKSFLIKHEAVIDIAGDKLFLK
ncbi:hypothetical protein OAQ99_04220 [Candidatus Kapabacteria bacterium]|nr:hypothetical protein [Candidatus Kapabacteria bacterium]